MTHKQLVALAFVVISAPCGCAMSGDEGSGGPILNFDSIPPQSEPQLESTADRQSFLDRPESISPAPFHPWSVESAEDA